MGPINLSLKSVVSWGFIYYGYKYIHLFGIVVIIHKNLKKWNHFLIVQNFEYVLTSINDIPFRSLLLSTVQDDMYYYNYCFYYYG